MNRPERVVIPENEDFPLEFDGPRMIALGDVRRQRFAWLMANGVDTATSAARKAGYADPGGHSASIRIQGHRLMQDPAIHEAIYEAGRMRVRMLGPIAIEAAANILRDKKHPAHARMIETVLDRSGHAAKTEHKVTVEHTVDMKELEALAARLARENGIAPERFIGIAHDAGAKKTGKSDAAPAKDEVIEGVIVREDTEL